MEYNTEIARHHFAIQGEDWLLQSLSNAGVSVNTVFDVGSNCGEWTRMAREFFPHAEIHTFEIMPEVYRKLLDNGVVDSKVFPNGFGLSDHVGTMGVKYCPVNDRLNTHLVMMYPGADSSMPFEWRECLVFTGDTYIKAQRIPNLDILKMDVEGAEDLVMKGFSETMKTSPPGLIQFEYGFANIVSRWLLLDSYELLTPLGYVMGKLSAQGIAFRDRFDLNDENFLGPNIVAVHRNRTDMLSALGYVR